MKSVTVKNNSQSPLGIPGNSLIMPGETAACNNWDDVKSSVVIKAWLKSGALSMVGDEVETADNEKPVEDESAVGEEDDILGEKSEEKPTRARRARRAR